MVDVSALDECTITPLNPNTPLSDTGLVIVNGTVNVTIQCNNCMNINRTLGTIRWYDPVMKRLLSPANRDFMADAPHFIRVVDANDDIILVIPTFNESHVGTYTCGDKNGPSGPPTATIMLTVGGR